MWGEGSRASGWKYKQESRIFCEKFYLLAGRTETSRFSSLLLSPFLFQGSSTDFWVSDNPFWLHCSFLCLSTSCSSPPAWSTLPWLLLLHGLDFSWEKKTFGASSIVEEYKEMPESCRNISWSSQTKLNLGGFWGKIRDCSSIFRKEVAHGLGFSRASAVQGINLGWLHPKKLDAILCSP